MWQKGGERKKITDFCNTVKGNYEVASNVNFCFDLNFISTVHVPTNKLQQMPIIDMAALSQPISNYI